MRINAIVFVVSLLAASAAQAAQSVLDEPVMLRESVIVSSNVVYLGDLFSGTGDKADAAISYAPEPGKRGTYDARWLYRVARAYGLDWKPLSIHVRVVVERQSVVIGRQEIEDHILAALLDQGIDADMQVELSNRRMRIYVASDADATLVVEDLDYEPRSRRFTAILAVPAEGPSAKRVRVTGRIHKVSEVPVLARAMLPGEVISADDVQWILVRTGRLGFNIILGIEDLVGKEPRRGLRAGNPVRTTDVRRPILVPRGSLVTMILRRPSMLLTAQGKAMENGSDGDTIRIINTQSSTVIEAVVIGAGKVSVRPVDHLVMN